MGAPTVNYALGGELIRIKRNKNGRIPKDDTPSSIVKEEEVGEGVILVKGKPKLSRRKGWNESPFNKNRASFILTLIVLCIVLVLIGGLIVIFLCKEIETAKAYAENVKSLLPNLITLVTVLFILEKKSKNRRKK